MRPIICIGVLICCLAPLCDAQAAQSVADAGVPGDIWVVRARTLIDGTSAQARANQPGQRFRK